MSTMDELCTLYASHGLQDYFEAAQVYGKNALHMDLTPCPDEDIPLGASKLGGCPHLPEDTQWLRMTTGKPLSFLGQINLEEAKPFDTEGKLPDRGMLYFFYDCSEDGMPWGFRPGDADGWRVLYYDGDLRRLVRREAPEDLDGNGCLFGSAKVTFRCEAELPDYFSSYGGLIELDDDAKGRMFDLLDEKAESIRNKLLGHSDNVQGSMEDECEMVSRGYDTGTHEGCQKARALGIHKNFRHWTLLCQIDSNEELDMMWGDAGKLYFWITQEDLAAKEFGKSWLILQCG